MSALNTAALRHTAVNAASQGEWRHLDNIHGDPVVVSMERYLAGLDLDVTQAPTEPRYHISDADHIVAMSPPTAVRVLDAVDLARITAEQILDLHSPTFDCASGQYNCEHCISLYPCRTAVTMGVDQNLGSYSSRLFQMQPLPPALLDTSSLRDIALGVEQFEWDNLSYSCGYISVAAITTGEKSTRHIHKHLTISDSVADRIGRWRPIGTILPLDHEGSRYGNDRAAHMAAFDPPTTLALLDELDQFDARMARLHDVSVLG